MTFKLTSDFSSNRLMRTVFVAVNAKRVLVLALSIGSLCAFSARADLFTMAPGFGPYQIGSGGEFTLIPNDAGAATLLSAASWSPLVRNYVAAGSFQTFCVERNEYITAGTPYEVTVNNITVFSGVPLSVGVAYLYQQFATGQLNYNYLDTPAGTRTGSVVVGGNFQDAYFLQQAMWYYMGEYPAVAANPFETLVGGLFGAGAFAPDNGAHGVAVLNLWSPGQPHDAAHAYQDVLILVPEPSTLALASLGAAALLAFRKRK